MKRYRSKHIYDGPKGTGFYPVRKLNGVDEPMELMRFNDEAECQKFCDSMNRAQQKHDQRQGRAVTERT